MAIIGRPNVGKSTLFNRMIGRSKANILDTPGLTRDRNYAPAEWNGKPFLLVDTGGYDPSDSDDMAGRIREQVRMAIDEADSILFLTEVEMPEQPIDLEILGLLRQCEKSFVLAVNKCDNPSREMEAYSFSSLGVENIFPISANHGLGIGELMDAIVKPLPEADEDISGETEEIRLAIVGKQNVGKSTLVNKILGEERVITSEVAGATRDAVDVPFQLGDKKYLIIDTAGIRRRGKVKRGPEHLSVTSSVMSIQRCDLAILLLEATTGVTAQDTHIGGYIQDAGRAAILAVNKWDALEKDTNTAGKFAKKIRQDFNFLSFAPIMFISALTGQRVTKLFSLVDEIMPNYQRRIETTDLNRQLKTILESHPPPLHKGKRLKINYITQVRIEPPTFALFVNNPQLMHFSYKRYLVNQIRQAFDLHNTPVRLWLRRK